MGSSDSGSLETKGHVLLPVIVTDVIRRRYTVLWEESVDGAPCVVKEYCVAESVSFEKKAYCQLAKAIDSVPRVRCGAVVKYEEEEGRIWTKKVEGPTVRNALARGESFPTLVGAVDLIVETAIACHRNGVIVDLDLSNVLIDEGDTGGLVIIDPFVEDLELGHQVIATVLLSFCKVYVEAITRVRKTGVSNLRRALRFVRVAGRYVGSRYCGEVICPGVDVVRDVGAVMRRTARWNWEYAPGEGTRVRWVRRLALGPAYFATGWALESISRLIRTVI